jgi:hypothetical protein
MTRIGPFRIATALMTAAAAGTAAAHEGHGAIGAHGHPTEVWGFIVVALVFCAAIVWLRGRS